MILNELLSSNNIENFSIDSVEICLWCLNSLLLRNPCLDYEVVKESIDIVYYVFMKFGNSKPIFQEGLWAFCKLFGKLFFFVCEQINFLKTFFQKLIFQILILSWMLNSLDVRGSLEFSSTIWWSNKKESNLFCKLYRISYNILYFLSIDNNLKSAAGSGNVDLIFKLFNLFSMKESVVIDVI